MNKDSHVQNGLEKLKEGLFEDAIDAFTAALSDDPQDAQALHGRASAFFQLNKWADAEPDFRAGRSADDRNPETWCGLALSLAMQEKIYPALETFEAAISRFPAYLPGQLQLGQLYFKLGAIAKGKEAFQRAL